MAREARPVEAINVSTRECRTYKSTYECAKDLGISIPAVQQAQDRNGVCKGWRLYCDENYLKRRIEALEKQLREIQLEKQIRNY